MYSLKKYSSDDTIHVIAVSVNEKKGSKNENIERCRLLKDFGLEGDAHAGRWHRQVSLLTMESIQKIKDKGITVNPGDFSENITTHGIQLWNIAVGSQLKIGEEVAGRICFC